METKAKDGFEKYFSEKFWAMVPDIYRYNDGLTDTPGALRSIIDLMAEQAAIVRRSNDRLWEDAFIELCNEWAVPYIGALVGTRMLSDKNKRGRRVDVAKTIYYRRRKGTPRVLEELISDITGWDGIMVENFHRLGRARHGLDPFPFPFAGRLTGTMPGGWADLRIATGSELADGPFEEYYHTPDMRFPLGLDGRYGIPKLAFYLYRLNFYELTDVTVFQKTGTGIFTFDPSGRDTALFQPRNGPADWNNWHPALEWELPSSIRCRLLGDAEYLITQTVIDQVLADPLNTTALTPQQSTDLAKFFGLPFRNEAGLRAAFESYPSLNAFDTNPAINFFRLLLKYGISVCGKSALLPNAVAVKTNIFPENFPVEETTAANLSNLTAAYLLGLTTSSFSKVLAIDPVRGRFVFLDNTTDLSGLTADYYMGFSGPTGAGAYTRPGIITTAADKTIVGGGAIHAADMPVDGMLQIIDDKTYGPADDPAPAQSLIIQAADEERPYLQIDGDWTFTALPNVDAELILDGLWIGCTATKQFNIVLDGKYSKVIFRNCTLDPGGDKNINGDAINAVWLTVKGTIDMLCIENCITGPVSILLGTGEVEHLDICDSIIQSTDTTVPAIKMDRGKTSVCRTTIFGDVFVDHLEASDVIVTGICTVSDTQHGCFRFSAAPKASQLPRPYESLLFSGDSRSWFNSRRFGDYSYAQLSDLAPEKLLSGGDEEFEMGAFSKLLNPFKIHDLEVKVEEYMPFGLIPIFIHQT